MGSDLIRFVYYKEFIMRNLMNNMNDNCSQ